MTGVFFADLSGLMALCRNTLHEVSVFSKTMLPVMAGAVSLTGAPTTATVMQGITLFSFDLFIRLMTELLLPAVGIYIAILTVDTAVGGGLLGRMAGFVKWAITGSMKITLTLFLAYLTISGVIGGSADALAVKTAKFRIRLRPCGWGNHFRCGRIHACRCGADSQHAGGLWYVVHRGDLSAAIFAGGVQLSAV